MPIMTTSQVPGYIERQKPRESWNQTVRFNWDYEQDEKRQTVFRILSWPKECYRFSYPAAVEEKMEDGSRKTRQGSAQINLSFPLAFDPKIGLKNYDNETRARGQAEQKLIDLFNFAYGVERESAIKRLMDAKGYSEEAAEADAAKFRLAPNELPYWVSWGKKSTLYGTQIVEDGGRISDCEIKAFTMSPWGYVKGRFTNKVGRDTNGAYIMEKGLNQLWRTVRDGKLVYTPFVSKVRVTAKKTQYKGRRNYLVYAPEILCDAQFQSKLPSVFAPCYWSHPDDAEKLSKHFSLSAEERAQVPPFAWRDYPDENGRLVFVALNGGQTHELSCVFTEGDITPELCSQIAERKTTHAFSPSTDLSLMGGFYYTDQHGEWVPISTEDALKLCTGKFDERGNPIVVVNGEETKIEYKEGKLQQKPLFLRYVTSQADLVLRRLDEIEAKVVELGLPLWSKDYEKPKPLDLKFLWEQEAPVSAPKETVLTTTTAVPEFSQPSVGTIEVSKGPEDSNDSGIVADDI